MITHHPFDHGRLDLLSSLARQKTIKAECGKRVPFASARAGAHVSCPACRASLQRRIADARNDLTILARPDVHPVVATSNASLSRAIERAIESYYRALEA